MPCPISTFPGETSHMASGENGPMTGQHRVCRKADRQFWRGGGGRGFVIGQPAISAAARSTRPHHAVMRSATAKVAVERRPHVLAGGIGFCIKSAAALIKMPEKHIAARTWLLAIKRTLKRMRLFLRFPILRWS